MDPATGHHSDAPTVHSWQSAPYESPGVRRTTWTCGQAAGGAKRSYDPYHARPPATRRM
jgi:hypothetical protein